MKIDSVYAMLSLVIRYLFRCIVYFCWVLSSYVTIFSARCNIYISRLCYDVCVHLSVRLSVTEVHWHIIANLGFKFRSHFTMHCGRRSVIFLRRRVTCVTTDLQPLIQSRRIAVYKFVIACLIDW